MRPYWWVGVARTARSVAASTLRLIRIRWAIRNHVCVLVEVDGRTFFEVLFCIWHTKTQGAFYSGRKKSLPHTRWRYRINSKINEAIRTTGMGGKKCNANAARPTSSAVRARAFGDGFGFRDFCSRHVYDIDRRLDTRCGECARGGCRDDAARWCCLGLGPCNFPAGHRSKYSYSDRRWDEGLADRGVYIRFKGKSDGSRYPRNGRETATH